jgi:hypothetical protein
MKKSIAINLMLLLLITVFSCKKDKTTVNPTTTPTTTGNYSSVGNFFAVNCSPMQTYTISAASGGSFTTPNGTIVTVPANAFITQNGGAVTGNVTINFKDVYKKSDMVLNKLSTNLFGGGLMKSAGMFYIKAMQGTQALMISAGNKISIKQPLNGLSVDNQMKPFILQKTPGDSISGWIAPQVNTDSSGHQNSYDSVYYATSSYIFNMYQFSCPADSGSWCNNDNSSYFSAYPQTTLTLNTLDSTSVYNTQIFLIFSNVNSMLWFDYNYTNTSFIDYYAPVGLKCTIVAIGVYKGNLYSSFTPITISSNLTVNFSLSQTTTAAFIAQLNALN